MSSMKIHVTQENLHKALAIVSRVADSRGSLPILSHILLKTDQNMLRLSATNLEIAISRKIGGKISSPGAITVPARLMNDFVASLPAGTIDLETENNKLHIKSGNYNSTINGVAAEEFPELPKVKENESVVFENAELKHALNQTVFASSNDDSRPVLTGVLLTTKHGNLNIVATDSYRLAEKTINRKTMKIDDTLIPASAAQDVLRILSDANDDAELFIEESQILFRIGETELVSRLIDGSFPDYKKLLPETAETNIVIDRKELINITKVASLFARESAGSITLVVSKDNQAVSITSVASQVGENTSTVDAKVDSDGEVTLNSRFLLDGLNAFSSETITFSFSGKVKPCIISAPDDAADKDYLHVVMPLKT